jgi:protein-disulfide isomerase
MFNRVIVRCWAVLMLGILAACGNQSIPTGTAPTAAALPPTRALAALPTGAAVIAPTVAGTQAPAPTAGAAQPENPAASIPDGLTPEGYHVLGRPDAPVTLVMYSDFL